MSKIPKYLEDRNEWEVEHFIQHARDGSLPINPEWQEAKDEALAAAGIELDDDVPKPLEEMSVAEHAARQSRGR